MFCLKFISYFMSLISPGRENCFLAYISIYRGTLGKQNVYKEAEISRGWFLPRGDFLSSGGIFDNAWRCFCLSKLGRRYLWHLAVGTRDAAKHPVTYRAALHDKTHFKMSVVERWRSPGVP